MIRRDGEPVLAMVTRDLTDDETRMVKKFEKICANQKMETCLQAITAMLFVGLNTSESEEQWQEGLRAVTNTLEIMRQRVREN